MQNWQFDNRFIQELPGESELDARSRQLPGVCWAAAQATPVRDPQLLAWSPELAEALELSEAEVRSERFAQVFAGNELLPGMVPYAARYGGHQFGHWAGQLGDGRALNLGEIVTRTGQRWELQLKGAGPTPFSRRADGRAVLRSSLREFLCSEAMFHLGVPTTRALSLITTGEEVVRDMLYDGNPAPEMGAIVCRVAPSFMRFGSFEILAAQQEPDLLAQLLDFTLSRDFPELTGSVASRRKAWFKTVCERTAELVAHWMRVGFVHGVMNTDNLSVLGLTLDYGPYGWIDNFDPGWTPNTTDSAQRRYRFGHQAQIAYWNLACLASAVAELFTDPEDLAAGLEHYAQHFAATQKRFTLAKFGFAELEATQQELVQQAYALMLAAEVDMSLFFRLLAQIDSQAPELSTLQPAFYTDAGYAEHQLPWQAWLEAYASQLPADPDLLAQRRAAMNAVNPCYVLRNYLAQEAIDLAEQGDTSRLLELQQALRYPYTERPEFAHLAQKRPDWARQRAGCSMLSCSS